MDSSVCNLCNRESMSGGKTCVSCLSRESLRQKEAFARGRSFQSAFHEEFKCFACGCSKLYCDCKPPPPKKVTIARPEFTLGENVVVTERSKGARARKTDLLSK